MRSLISAYEANRDLVLMGAYQPGRDALLDRAMAMHPAIEDFLRQERGESASLEATETAFAALLNDGQ